MPDRAASWKVDESQGVFTSGPCRLLFVLMGLTLSFSLLAFEARALAQETKTTGQTKIDGAVYAAFQRRGSASVCVELQHTARGHEALAERSKKFREAQQKFLDALPDGSYRVRYRYRYSPIVVLEINAAPAFTHMENALAVRRVMADVKGEGGLVESRRLIGVDQLHERGILGAGRVTAVLDSGVDTDHPDLEGAIVHQYHFLGRGLDQGEGAEDDHGHGTHVTGIIASRGQVAPLGVAPGSAIVSIKVLDHNNRG